MLNLKMNWYTASKINSLKDERRRLEEQIWKIQVETSEVLLKLGRRKIERAAWNILQFFCISVLSIIAFIFMGILDDIFCIFGVNSLLSFTISLSIYMSLLLNFIVIMLNSIVIIHEFELNYLPQGFYSITDKAFQRVIPTWIQQILIQVLNKEVRILIRIHIDDEEEEELFWTPYWEGRIQELNDEIRTLDENLKWNDNQEKQMWTEIRRIKKELAKIKSNIHPSQMLR